MSRYEDFRNEYLGHAVDIDGSFGAQCWDGAMFYSEYLGYPRFHCGITGYAQDIWTQRNTSGILNYYDEVTMMQPGDIAVFAAVPGITPLSHIAIFDHDIDGVNGAFFGQNQGGQNGAFNIVSLPYSATYPTAFRPKCFANQAPAPTDDNVYGVDLSAHNGTVDFSALKAAGNSFVILRAGFGWSLDQKDPNFDAYYKAAKESGLKVGAYWYSYARDLSEAQAEAECFQTVINGLNLELGAWVDLEDADGWKTHNGNPTGAQQAACANHICKQMRQHGWKSGIYASAWFIDNVYKGLDQSLLWIADYGSNTGHVEKDYSNRAMMYQFTSTYKLNGQMFDRNVLYENSINLQEGKQGSIYRLYNPTTGDHLYTANVNETRVCMNDGWTYEGICWIAPESGDPVYRLLMSGRHIFTTSEEEKKVLTERGATDEGIGFYSGGPVEIWRMYNPNTGDHALTANRAEHNGLSKAGWYCEGQKIRATSDK